MFKTQYTSKLKIFKIAENINTIKTKIWEIIQNNVFNTNTYKKKIQLETIQFFYLFIEN